MNRRGTASKTDRYLSRSDTADFTTSLNVNSILRENAQRYPGWYWKSPYRALTAPPVSYAPPSAVARYLPGEVVGCYSALLVDVGPDLLLTGKGVGAVNAAVSRIVEEAADRLTGREVGR